ncbi:MAG TPA: hypothetical protein PLU30_09770 [Verrucomicrobiae bacterium]|nr:hypothetical protein [Verrucomicrobiae bacterium]
MNTPTRLVIASGTLALIAIALWMWSGHLTEQQRLIKTAEKCCRLANDRKYWDASRYIGADLRAAIEREAGGIAAAIRIAAEHDSTDAARYSVGRLLRWEQAAGTAQIEIVRHVTRERRREAIAVPWQRRNNRWEIGPGILETWTW